MFFKLLVIDNDQSWLRFVKGVFARDDIEILLEPQESRATQRVLADKPNIVMLTIQEVNERLQQFITETKKADPRLAIIIAAKKSTVKDAIEAMKFGAFDYVTKPLNDRELRDVVEKALSCSIMCRRVRYANNPAEIRKKGHEDIMIGSSGVMMDIWKRVGLIADSDSTVLILGESGTGKELLARAVYLNSLRSGRPFLAINCAAIPETLMESELFGHEQGAFTDAHARRIGKFEECHTGTLLLDEIGDLSLPNQSKLLRVLEQQSFERVGGNKPIKTDVRLIATTSVDLEAAVREKRFRLDLYHRLSVVLFRVPPLRERVEDIPLLVKLFVETFCRDHGKLEKMVSPKLMQALKLHRWEGNIRELKNMVNRAVILSKSELLDLEDFPQLTELRSCKGVIATARDDCYGTFKDILEPDLEEICVKYNGRVNKQIMYGVEKALILLVMERCKDNESLAAKMMGISRNTLRYKLKQYSEGNDTQGRDS
jgi:two-component system, NtrC family, nitrogen regulation response regulator GlnG